MMRQRLIAIIRERVIDGLVEWRQYERTDPVDMEEVNEGADYIMDALLRRKQNETIED